MAFILIDLDKHIPGDSAALISNQIDAKEFCDYLNSKMTDEDRSYGHIEVSGDAPGSRNVLRVYGQRVEREQVEHLLEP